MPQGPASFFPIWRALCFLRGRRATPERPRSRARPTPPRLVLARPSTSPPAARFWRNSARRPQCGRGSSSAPRSVHICAHNRRRCPGRADNNGKFRFPGSRSGGAVRGKSGRTGAGGNLNGYTFALRLKGEKAAAVYDRFLHCTPLLHSLRERVSRTGY